MKTTINPIVLDAAKQGIEHFKELKRLGRSSYKEARGLAYQVAASAIELYVKEQLLLGRTGVFYSEISELLEIDRFTAKDILTVLEKTNAADPDPVNWTAFIGYKRSIDWTLDNITQSFLQFMREKGLRVLGVKDATMRVNEREGSSSNPICTKPLRACPWQAQS